MDQRQRRNQSEPSNQQRQYDESSRIVNESSSFCSPPVRGESFFVSKASRFAFSVNEPPRFGSSRINAMRHAGPPSLRYGALSSCGQHSRTTWPRRWPCGVGLTAGKAGRFTYPGILNSCKEQKLEL